MKRRIATTLIALALAGPAFGAGFEMLVPHRAVYEIKLREAEQRSGIEGMTGRIVYEMTGNECEGISINYRFVTRINTGDALFVTDQHTATHESADGSRFSFRTRSFVNEQPDQTIGGNAQLGRSGVTVRFEKPEKRTIELEPALFVSSHLIAIIEKAKAGESIARHDVFDGSGDADKVLASTSIIGRKRAVKDKLEGEGEFNTAPFEKHQAWPVSMSYFDKSIGATAESIPVYESSFLLYENGITRRLVMKYPDYSLNANLAQLEILEAKPCELDN